LDFPSFILFFLFFCLRPPSALDRTRCSIDQTFAAIAENGSNELNGRFSPVAAFARFAKPKKSNTTISCAGWYADAWQSVYLDLRPLWSTLGRSNA